MPTYYLLSQQEPDSCAHERIYATREMAERNLRGAHLAAYGRYLKSYGGDLSSAHPDMGDPTPRTFAEWLEDEHGWVVEELEFVG